MSLRTSRRSQAAAASAAGEEVPSVPISEIRVRKWTKQVRTVGHISIVKWVPDQEFPTDALQKGGFKKTKGRKRPAAEVGRMTRSVRQHLDAPLELLVEMPPIRQSTRATASLGLPVVPIPAVPTVTPAPAPATEAVTAAVAAPLDSAPAASPQMASTASSESLMGMSGDSMMFSDGVASEEQLERALDDLPFLDTDNLAMDPALALDRQEAAQAQRAAVQAQPTHQAAKNPPPLAAMPSPDAEASAASAEEVDDGASSSSDSSDDDDDEDDDDDDDGTASVDSATATPLPSPSPAASPSTSP